MPWIVTSDPVTGERRLICSDCDGAALSQADLTAEGPLGGPASFRFKDAIRRHRDGHCFDASLESVELRR